MILSSDCYVPSLRWRQGEYQALMRLSDDAKLRTVPLLTIPAIEFDFELRQPKKTVHQHVHPFPRRYKAKWSTRSAWIDVEASILAGSMNDGADVFTYVFDGLREFKAEAVPVITIAADDKLIAIIKSIISKDRKGLGLRARFEDIMRPTFSASVRQLATKLGIELSDIDLFLDLGSPSYEPYATFAGALITAFGMLADLGLFRNFVLIGTAIPESMGDVTKEGADLPRHDWLFYNELLAKLPSAMRRPNYGDYTIVHPSFAPVDMRMIKSAGKVVYATSKVWNVVKGGAFRDNPQQMHGHCSEIIKRPFFKGANFSYGDRYIDQCAKREEEPSNQTQWKKVGINHHITLVLEDLATLVAVA